MADESFMVRRKIGREGRYYRRDHTPDACAV
jgi:hypothetical protein